MHVALLTKVIDFSVPVVSPPGSPLGIQRQGIDIYLIPGSSLLRKPESKIGHESAASESRTSDRRPTESGQPSQREVVGLNWPNGQGFFSGLFNQAPLSGQHQNVWGMAAPTGVEQGVVPLAAEWDMRRQMALRSLDSQLLFMRQSFSIDPGLTCEASSDRVSCHPVNEGLMSFLRLRHQELKLLDPAFPNMRWFSQGDGNWTYEFIQ
jgi:hypothetical protein